LSVSCVGMSAYPQQFPKGTRNWIKRDEDIVNKQIKDVAIDANIIGRVFGCAKSVNVLMQKAFGFGAMDTRFVGAGCHFFQNARCLKACLVMMTVGVSICSFIAQ
jgi:hypothetical protein